MLMMLVVGWGESNPLVGPDVFAIAHWENGSSKKLEIFNDIVNDDGTYKREFKSTPTISMPQDPTNGLNYGMRDYQ